MFPNVWAFPPHTGRKDWRIVFGVTCLTCVAILVSEIYLYFHPALTDILQVRSAFRILEFSQGYVTS